MHRVCTMLYLLCLLLVCWTAYFLTPFNAFKLVSWTEQYYAVTLFTFLLALMVKLSFVKSNWGLMLRSLRIISVIVASALIHSGLLHIHTLLNTQNTLIKQWVWGLSFCAFLIITNFSALYLCALKNSRNPPHYIQYLISLSLLFVSPLLSQLASYWIPGLLISSPEQFVINMNLAQSFAVMLCITFIFTAQLNSKTVSHSLIVLLALIIQAMAIWRVNEGSFWAWLAKVYSELAIVSVFIFTGMFAALFAFVALYIIYKRA